MNIWFT